MPTPFGQTPVRRLVLIVVTVVAVVVVGVGVGIARAADQRLTEADMALQKAAALVEASQTGGTVSPQAQKRFDKAVAQALEDIADARAEIVLAIEAADS
jgi:sensor histidine kinase regulating citrate/malate metabolism